MERLRKQNAPASESLHEELAVAEQLLKQTDLRLEGVDDIPDRIVSFHDPEARAICRGKPDKPTEFGRTMQLTQDESGLILDYEIQQGNPSDKTKLLPQVERFVEQFGYAPNAVATDKGYYTLRRYCQDRSSDSP